MVPRRTDPARLVSLRCLVCLREAEKLRRDQVCEACQKSWTRTGRPWSEDYERWVIQRRVTRADTSTEHLADSARALLSRFVRGTEPRNEPLTRDTIMPIMCVGYNQEWRFADTGGLAEEFQATADLLPNLTWPIRLAAFYLFIQMETIMHAPIELTLKGTPESVVAAIRRMGNTAVAEEPEVESFIDSLPGELGNVIKMRATASA